MEKKQSEDSVQTGRGGRGGRREINWWLYYRYILVSACIEGPFREEEETNHPRRPCFVDCWQCISLLLSSTLVFSILLTSSTYFSIPYYPFRSWSQWHLEGIASCRNHRRHQTRSSPLLHLLLCDWYHLFATWSVSHLSSSLILSLPPQCIHLSYAPSPSLSYHWPSLVSDLVIWFL